MSKMRKRAKNNLLYVCMIAAFVLTGCYDSDSAFSVRSEIIDVGKAHVGDSVSASFTFRNNMKESIAITFLPECDCTTVSSNTMRLQPRECGKLEVKVAVESEGEFIKYVYVQASGAEDFMTIAVKGHAK